MREFKKHIPGLLISLVLAGITVLFILVLVWSQMIPTKYLILGGLAVVLAAAASILLVRTTEYKVQFTFGTIIAVLMAAVMVVGGLYLYKTMLTLNTISNVHTQYTPVGVFVRVDDPAETIDDAEDYSFGALETLDAENTEKTVAELNDLYGKEIPVQSYAGLGQLVNGLMDDEVDAIILNTAYVDVFEEMEGYENVAEEIRELEVIQVETVIEEPEPDTTAKEDEPEQDAESDENTVYTIYISGSDSRVSLNAQARSDVNIIATVNTETRQVLLLSTPRDYFVPLSISNGVPDKLTHAGLYGVDVSMETLEMLYDTDIDYYFRVDFGGFIDIVDALGGITLENDIAFYADGFNYPAGEITMNGEKALRFARERHSFAGGDRQRGINQMKVISAVIDKALSPEILTKYLSLMDSLEDSFQMNIPYSDIASLVRRQLEDNRGWDILQYSVTGTGDSQIPYSMGEYAYVMWPDDTTVEKAQELMQMVRDGEILTEADLQLTE